MTSKERLVIMRSFFALAEELGADGIEDVSTWGNMLDKVDVDVVINGKKYRLSAEVREAQNE